LADIHIIETRTNRNRHHNQIFASVLHEKSKKGAM
jgi:hypothetical protein